MKASSHIKIAKFIANELNLENNDCSNLRDGSVKPDSWKDFPHHYNVNNRIKNFMIISRKRCLEKNQKAHLRSLGVVFHYIADKWTLFPGSEEKHATWEEKINKCQLADIYSLIDKELSFDPNLKNDYTAILQKSLSPSRSKLDALSIAWIERPNINQTAYSSPEIDYNIVLRICLGIALCIKSMSTPPNELLKALNLLRPWTSSQELLKRPLPKELEDFCIDSIKSIKEIELKKQEIAKTPKSNLNFIKNLYLNHKIESAIRKLESIYLEEKEKFNAKVEQFIDEYAPYIDWYFWGSIDHPTVWRLKDTFRNNQESYNIIEEIYARAIEEITSLSKSGFIIAPPGKRLTVSISLKNPTKETIKSAFFDIKVPEDWKIIGKPEYFDLPANNEYNTLASIQIPDTNKLGNYLIEIRPQIKAPTFVQHKSGNNIQFIKVSVITKELLRMWENKSLKGQLCGIAGCSKHPTEQCPICKLHYCLEHKIHNMHESN